MIATDKFVFAHLPRSGGTFVGGIIKKFFPSACELGHHLPRELLPNKYSHLPMLGTVRNPWEFYVSLYHYVWPKDASSVLVSWMTENGKHEFLGSTRKLLNLGVDDEQLDILVSMLPEEVDFRTRSVPNISKAAMARVRGTGVGYYTARFNQLYGDANNVFFCRIETLRHDLVTFFEKHNLLTDELRHDVLRLNKENSSEHRHYSTYYTPDLAKLVLARDRQLIDRFGYSFDESV